MTGPALAIFSSWIWQKVATARKMAQRPNICDSWKRCTLYRMMQTKRLRGMRKQLMMVDLRGWGRGRGVRVWDNASLGREERRWRSEYSYSLDEGHRRGGGEMERGWGNGEGVGTTGEGGLRGRKRW